MALPQAEELFPGEEPEDPRDRGFGQLRGLITQDIGSLTARSRRLAKPFFKTRIGPALERAVAAQLGRPGASASGILEGLATTGGFEVARELSGIQAELQAIKQGIPRATGIQESAIEGGAEGLVAGGPVGAASGAVAGVLGSKGDRDAEQRRQQRVASAQLAATPEGVFKEAEEQEALARELALSSGAGAQNAQVLEAIISQTGLRDTGIGTLASIAAGIQVPVIGVQATLGLALDETRKEVEAEVGAIFSEKADRNPLARALEGLSTFFLTRQKGKEKDEETPTDLFPIGPEDTEDVTAREGIF